MTETTKKIFESHEVRKTKKQKTAFIKYMKTVADEMGYPFKLHIGRRAERNIMIGDPKHARVVFTAHYDTQPVMPMPNFITPRNIFLYILYQLFMVAALMALPALLFGFGAYFAMTALSIGAETARAIAYFIAYGVFLFMLFFILLGPSNRHTANDNTSGVTTLVDIMHDLPPELRGEAAFVFFDLEEMGLVGSASFYKTYKSFMKDKLVINFDCVSDGDNILFVLKKGAHSYADLLRRAYPTGDEFSVEVITRGYVYPSDQANFPCGVGVCALKRSKKFGVLYMNKIHTNRDIVYNEQNIEYLKDSSITLVQMISVRGK